MATKLTHFGQLPCLILHHNIALSFAVLGALLIIPFSDCSVILSNHTVHFILLFKILKTFFLLQPTLIKIWLALLIFSPLFFRDLVDIALLKPQFCFLKPLITWSYCPHQPSLSDYILSHLLYSEPYVTNPPITNRWPSWMSCYWRDDEVHSERHVLRPK